MVMLSSVALSSSVLKAWRATGLLESNWSTISSERLITAVSVAC